MENPDTDSKPGSGMSKQVLAGWVLGWTGIIGGAAGLVGALVVWRILARNDADIWAVLLSTIGLCTLSVALLLMAQFALENMMVNSNQTRIRTTILQLTLKAFWPDHPSLKLFYCLIYGFGLFAIPVALTYRLFLLS